MHRIPSPVIRLVHLVVALLVVPLMLALGFLLAVRYRMTLLRGLFWCLFSALARAAALSGWPVQASDLGALSAIESGDQDRAVGRKGEVSRYQILPQVWHSYTSSTAYRDPRIAAQVASLHLARIRSAFMSRTGRAASDFDLYVMWNAGLGYYARRGFSPALVAASIADRASRFARLKKALQGASKAYSAASDLEPFPIICLRGHFTPVFCTQSFQAHFRA